MQTFVPFDDIYLIAQVLDTKRLFKQAVEAKQILIALRKLAENAQAAKAGYDPVHMNVGWGNHPATKM